MEKRRTAVITGSTRGIGLAIAKQLGLDGANIVMIGTHEQARYQDAVGWFAERKIPLLYIQADVSKREDRQKIVDETLGRFGEIHILVNNAGIAPVVRRDLLEMDEGSFDRLIDVNAKAPLFLTQLVAKAMLRQPRETRDAVIVFVTSCSSVVSSINRGEYCMSKAAESMAATLFAARLAPEGILVHEVRPGVIKTDMTSVVQQKYDALIKDGAFPVARWGEPEDVALAVSAFCSGKFRFTTGNYVDVDGGFHIPRL